MGRDHSEDLSIYWRINVTSEMDLREIGWEAVEWTQLAQDRDQWRDLVIMVMNLRVP
jgi:hypothetical protein